MHSTHCKSCKPKRRNLLVTEVIRICPSYAGELQHTWGLTESTSGQSSVLSLSSSPGLDHILSITLGSWMRLWSAQVEHSVIALKDQRSWRSFYVAMQRSELKISMLGVDKCTSFRHVCVRSWGGARGALGHGNIEKIPNKYSVVVGAADNLKLVKLESEDSASMLL